MASQEPSGENIEISIGDDSQELAAMELSEAEDMWVDLSDTIFAAMGDYGWMPRTMMSRGFVAELKDLIEDYFQDGGEEFIPDEDEESSETVSCESV